MTVEGRSFVSRVAVAMVGAGLWFQPSARAGDFRVTPYLQNPATNAMTVMWFAQTNSTGQIRYWPQGGGPTVAVDSVATLAADLDYHASETNKANSLPYTVAYRHQVRLTQLTAGATYDYVVTQDVSAYTNRFRTTPARDTAIRFVCYGDSETEPESTGKKTSDWTDPATGSNRQYLVDMTTGYASNLAVIAQRNPDLIVAAGDLVESGGEQRDWDEFWRHNAGDRNDIAGRTPILAATGNHEYSGGTRGGYSQPYSEQSVRKYLAYFDNPGNGVGNAEQQERFYRVDYGPATIIVLDLNNGDDGDLQKDCNYYLKRADGCQGPDFNPGSVQYQWLEAQLADAQTNSRFTFVVSHQVPFSVGYHGRTNSFAPEELLSGVATRVLTNLMTRYGVDAWLCGHDEMYEHSQVQGREIDPGGFTNAYSLHVYDTGTGGDGLRGQPLVSNTWETFRAHVGAPEQYDAAGVLTNGGKHYGHLEVNIGTNAEGAWEARLTPVYVFVYTNSSGVAQGFERRVYDDEVVLATRNAYSRSPRGSVLSVQ